jgi:hypothetical protein
VTDYRLLTCISSTDPEAVLVRCDRKSEASVGRYRGNVVSVKLELELIPVKKKTF